MDLLKIQTKLQREEGYFTEYQHAFVSAYGGIEKWLLYYEGNCVGENKCDGPGVLELKDNINTTIIELVFVIEKLNSTNFVRDSKTAQNLIENLSRTKVNVQRANDELAEEVKTTLYGVIMEGHRKLVADMLSQLNENTQRAR